MLVMKISTKEKNMFQFIDRLLVFLKNRFKENPQGKAAITGEQREYYLIEDKDEGLPFI